MPQISLKKILNSALFLIGIICLSTSPAQAFEEISSFESKININQNTSLEIVETIEYQTDISKHGIYRYIPITYNQDGTKTNLRIDVKSITDENGLNIPYSQTYDGPYITLKIGDPDQTFVGDQTYRISYSVDQALKKFDEHHELYWDITGEGWEVPIASSTALITSPHAEIKNIACYSGKVGGDDELCQTELIDKDSAKFIYPQTLNYGQNMTVVIGLNPDNQLLFPTQSQKFLSWLWYNWVIFIIPLPILIIFSWWWKKGRDLVFDSPNVFDLDPDRPSHLRPLELSTREPMVHAPLDDLSAGEAGALIDVKADPQDVVAEILELARKKYLKIDSITKKKLFGTDIDYSLSKLKEADKKLSDVQKYLHQQLFKKKDQTKISELKGSFYTAMSTAAKKLDQALVKKKIYRSDPNQTRVVGFMVFFASMAAVFGLSIWQLAVVNIFWPIPFLVLQLPIGFWLAYSMPQKTAVGFNLWLQARGLRKSIKYGKWREEIKEKNLFIEEVLPFAVSLGVVKELSKHMKDLNIKAPDYLPNNNLAGWTAANIISDFSQSTSSSLSYNPSSSSSSGGSGFSGGSSGGGGGGGGGGSW